MMGSDMDWSSGMCLVHNGLVCMHAPPGNSCGVHLKIRASGFVGHQCHPLLVLKCVQVLSLKWLSRHGQHLGICHWAGLVIIFSSGENELLLINTHKCLMAENLPF